MTNKTWGIILAVSIIITAAGTMIGSYFLFRCDAVSSVINIGDIQQGPTEQHQPGSTSIDKCGALLFDAKMTQDGKFMHVKGWNKCISSYADFPITCVAPVLYKKYSIGIQLMLLAGYNKDIKKFDVIAGGEIFFLRNFKHGSIGVGLIYQQGLLINQYYAGAAVLGKFDFGSRI